jgi:hypothetical protein
MVWSPPYGGNGRYLFNPQTAFTWATAIAGTSLSSSTGAWAPSYNLLMHPTLSMQLTPADFADRVSVVSDCVHQ